jgi:hypothetical protein
MLELSYEAHPRLRSMRIGVYCYKAKERVGISQLGAFSKNFRSLCQSHA